MADPKKSQTPASGVPVASDRWDDDTPVIDASTVLQDAAGARSTARAPSEPGYPGGQMPQSQYPPPRDNASARKALAKIDELGRRFDEHAELDRAQLEEVKGELKRTAEKLDDHGEKLTSLLVATTRTSTELGALTSEMRYERELKRAEAIASIQDKKDEIAHERKLKFEWRAIVPALAKAVLVAGGGALITAIATGKLQLHC